MFYDRGKRVILFLLITAGAASSGCVLVYVLQILSHNGFSLLWTLLSSYFVAYLSFQFYFVWYLYCLFEKREIPQAPPGLSVDVFIPAFNEGRWIVKRTLKAANVSGHQKDTRFGHDGSLVKREEM